MSAAGNAGNAANAAGMPGIRIVGRTLEQGNRVRFGWPGVAFHARFFGTQASIQLMDGDHQNAFQVSVDGGPAKKFRTVTGQTSYRLASGLALADHEVSVWRSTEVFDSGSTELIAIDDFGSGGALLPPPPAPERRIEVIGDSISVGAGLEGGPANCAADKHSTDNFYAYGSVAARAVQADVVTVAYSGIGVYRSYGGDLVMPARYDRAVPNEDAAWNFSGYQPHVVVINLGTNDFNSGNPGRAFLDAYVAFAKHVRAKYPGAHFILVAMYESQEGAVGEVVSKLKQGGDTKIELLAFNAVQNNRGCTQHPDAAAHQAMGSLLAMRIKAATGW